MNGMAAMVKGTTAARVPMEVPAIKRVGLLGAACCMGHLAMGQWQKHGNGTHACWNGNGNRNRVRFGSGRNLFFGDRWRRRRRDLRNELGEVHDHHFFRRSVLG